MHSNCDSEIDSLLLHMLPCYITDLFPDTFHVVVCFSTIRHNLSLGIGVFSYLPGAWQ